MAQVPVSNYAFTGAEMLIQHISASFASNANHHCEYRDVCSWAIPLLTQQDITWDIMEAHISAVPDPLFPTIDQSDNLVALDSLPGIALESVSEVMSEAMSESTSDCDNSPITCDYTEEMSEDEDDSDEDDSNIVLETTYGNVTFSTS